MKEICPIRRATILSASSIPRLTVCQDKGQSQIPVIVVNSFHSPWDLNKFCYLYSYNGVVCASPSAPSAEKFAGALTKFSGDRWEMPHHFSADVIKDVRERERNLQESCFPSTILGCLCGGHRFGLHALTVEHILQHFFVRRNCVVDPLLDLVERWTQSATAHIFGIPYSDLPLHSAEENLSHHFMTRSMLSCKLAPLKFVKSGRVAGTCRIRGISGSGRIDYIWHGWLPAQRNALVNGILRKILD